MFFTWFDHKVDTSSVNFVLFHFLLGQVRLFHLLVSQVRHKKGSLILFKIWNTNLTPENGCCPWLLVNCFVILFDLVSKMLIVLVPGNIKFLLVTWPFIRHLSHDPFCYALVTWWDFQILLFGYVMGSDMLQI